MSHKGPYRPRAQCRPRRRARTHPVAALVLAVLGLAAGAIQSDGKSVIRRPTSKAPCSASTNHRPSVPAAPMPAGTPLALTVSTHELGCIYLQVSGASASSVSMSELVPGVATPTQVAVLATPNGQAALPE